MDNAEWKDTSSFSKGDKANVRRSFELRIGQLRVTVFRLPRVYPGDWLATCDPCFECVVVNKGGTADEAKAAALELVRAKLQESLDALKGVA